MGDQLSATDRIQLIFDTYGAENVLKVFNKIELGAVGADMAVKKFGVSMKETDFLSMLRGQADSLKKGVEEVKKASWGVQVGFNLSLLFLGQGIQRFSKQILSSLYTVYDKFDGTSSTMSKNIKMLSASFLFLRYSIAESLEGTIIETFTTKIATLFVELANFFQEHPEWGKNLVILFGTLFAVGTGAMLFGQMALFVNSTVELFGLQGPFQAAFKKAMLNIATMWNSTWLVIPRAVVGGLAEVLVVVVAAAIALLEFSGIETQWRETLTGMWTGWREFWNGITTDDSKLMTRGISRIFGNLGMLTSNLLTGLGELFIEGAIINFVLPFYELGKLAMKLLMDGFNGGEFTPIKDIIELSKAADKDKQAVRDMVDFKLFDAAKIQEVNDKITDQYKSLTELRTVIESMGKINPNLNRTALISTVTKVSGIGNNFSQDTISAEVDAFLEQQSKVMKATGDVTSLDEAQNAILKKINDNKLGNTQSTEQLTNALTDEWDKLLEGDPIMKNYDAIQSQIGGSTNSTWESTDNLALSTEWLNKSTVKLTPEITKLGTAISQLGTNISNLPTKKKIDIELNITTNYTKDKK